MRRAAHQVGGTAHVAAFLDLVQYFFEGGFLLPLTLYAFQLLFLHKRQDCLGPCSRDGGVLPHPAHKLFHSKYLPQHATECFPFQHFFPLCCLLWLFALLSSPIVVALLVQIDCVNFTTFLRHNGRELEVLEALLTAFIVAKVQGPHRFTYRTWHTADLVNLFWLRSPHLRRSKAYSCVSSDSTRITALHFGGCVSTRTACCSSTSHAIKPPSASVLAASFPGAAS